MGQPRVGVQLIIFGERAQADLTGVLSELAAVGYDGFEGGAPATAAEADRVRAAMEGKSLGYVGGHCGEDQVRKVGHPTQGSLRRGYGCEKSEHYDESFVS